MGFRDEHNFSGGPGALPATVLTQVRQAIEEVPDTGLSLLGLSHRSDWFAALLATAEARLRQLLGLDDAWAVLFLQGGATQQFSMVPMSFLRRTGPAADYIETGYWSAKSLPHASRCGPVRIAYSGRAEGFRALPEAAAHYYNSDAAYLHYVSNETVEGLQFHHIPGHATVRRFCDMSSDFLSRPIDLSRFDLIYAHAQKNIGPAGVTVVLLRRDLLAQIPDDLPDFLDYRQHLAAASRLNTPPVFAIFVVERVLHWLQREVGGLTAMQDINARKAATLYAVIDEFPHFYRPHARTVDRSQMNVVLHLPCAEDDEAFLQACAQEGFVGLAGHRSLGGVRASLYNAMGLAATEDLADFMRHYARRRA